MEAPEAEAWPPDYMAVYEWRQKTLAQIRGNPIMLAGMKEYYREHIDVFVDSWCDTYDPRMAGSGRSAFMPFKMFKRQRELTQFVLSCLKGEGPGLVEKCRDMGATWTCVSVSNAIWLFWEGAAVGWGSRKEPLVDRLGDPDSIFEKIRMQLRALPREFLPAGFSFKEHATYMKLINPETGATITGEGGDNIGRGGRKLIYFKDESAHYERPEKIEAALADNTNVQIDISSVNGLGNVFHRRREAGIEWAPGAEIQRTCANVFIMDWRDHPAKDQAWYDMREAKAISDGLLHIHEQEINRNYGASVEGVIIDPKWVKAAIDAHLCPDIKLAEGDAWEDGPWGAALDVADGGMDRNAIAVHKGSVFKRAREWGDRDTAVTTRNALDMVSDLGALHLQYDSISVGSGVKAEANRLADEDKLPKGLVMVPWNAGLPALNPLGRVNEGDPESALNKDFFENLKAQGWFHLGRRFYNTYRARTQGLRFKTSEMISLSSDLPKLRQIEKELSQPTRGLSAKMRMLVNKTPEGTKSPNLGDAIMMATWPMPVFETPTAIFGTYGRIGG